MDPTSTIDAVAQTASQYRYYSVQVTSVVLAAAVVSTGLHSCCSGQSRGDVASMYPLAAAAASAVAATLAAWVQRTFPWLVSHMVKCLGLHLPSHFLPAPVLALPPGISLREFAPSHSLTAADSIGYCRQRMRGALSAISWGLACMSNAAGSLALVGVIRRW